MQNVDAPMHATLHSRISHLYVYNLVWLRFATIYIIRVRAPIWKSKEKTMMSKRNVWGKSQLKHCFGLAACIICIITIFSIENSHGRGSLRINQTEYCVSQTPLKVLWNPFSYSSIGNSSNSIMSAIFSLDFPGSSMWNPILGI